jgi:hypothetical protein
MKDVGKDGEPYGARPLYGKTIGLLVSRCHCGVGVLMK